MIVRLIFKSTTDELYAKHSEINRNVPMYEFTGNKKDEIGTYIKAGWPQ